MKEHKRRFGDIFLEGVLDCVLEVDEIFLYVVVPLMLVSAVCFLSLWSTTAWLIPTLWSWHPVQTGYRLIQTSGCRALNSVSLRAVGRFQSCERSDKVSLTAP